MRKRTVNYEQIIKTTADSYSDPDWMHGLQKDAIQNSWDAVANKKGKGWAVAFDLVTVNDRKFFIIQDFGTKGLTGSKKSDGFANANDIPKEERWAKFESYGSTKEDAGDLGSRGQGKFLFIYASGNGRCFYDSLREDGTYRFGLTENSGADVESWTEREAEGKIMEMIGFGKISDGGTRIIIEQPKPEFVKFYKGGSFLAAIEETWWPLIKKYEVQIILKENGKEISRAGVPEIFSDDSLAHQDPRHKDDNFPIKCGRETVKVKHLFIAYDENLDNKKFSGVNIFRNGMKVTDVRFKGSLEHNDKIFGFVEFDGKTNELLREVENPNHYGFNKSPLWGNIEGHIQNRLNAFAKEHLGIGREEHQKKKDVRLEREVTALISNVLRELNIPFNPDNAGGSLTPSPPSPTPPTPLEGPYIYDYEALYSESEYRRVSYGDTLKCRCKVYAEKFSGLRIKIGIYRHTQWIKSLTKGKGISVTKKSREMINAEGKITKKQFNPGKYIINFKLTNGDEILDEKNRPLYIEDYPPSLNFPFKVVATDALSDDVEWRLDYDGKKFRYNIRHNFYKKVESLGEDLLNKHLAEMGAKASVEFVLTDIDRGNRDKKDLEGHEIFKILLNGDDTEKVTAGLKLSGQIRRILYGG